MGFDRNEAAPNYSEVFGGHHGTGGVPVLKLPPLQQQQDDVALADYAQVFGGYKSFAPSYEQLFRTHREAPSSFNSRQSVQGNALLSENGMQFSKIDIQQSLYDQGANFVNFKHAHSCQTDTRVVEVDESSHLKGTDTSACVSVRRSSDCIKDTVLDTEKRAVNHVDAVSQNSLELKEPCLTVSGISLRTHPSEYPPPSREPPRFDIIKEDFNGLHTKPRAGPSRRSYSFQGTVSLQKIYDVEVDASSVASAMLDAMEKAQTKLTSANEIPEGKKLGVPRRLRLNPKKSSMERDIDGSNKLSETLVHKIQVAAEGKKLFAGDEYENIARNTETISQSITLPDDGPSNVFREPVEDVLKCNGDREVLWYKPSSNTSRQPVGVCTIKEISCERTVNEEEPLYKNELMDVSRKANFKNIKVAKKLESQEASIVDKRTLTDHQSRETRKLYSEKCNASEDVQEKEVYIADDQREHHKIGFEHKKDICIRVHNSRRGSSDFDPEDVSQSENEPNGSTGSTEEFGVVFERQSDAHVTLSQDCSKLENPHLDYDITSMKESLKTVTLSEDRIINYMAEGVKLKPLHSLHDLEEKLDLKARDAQSEGDIRTKLRLKNDSLLETNGLISTLKYEENNSAEDESIWEKINGLIINDTAKPDLDEKDETSGAAATGNQAPQKITSHSRTLFKNLPESRPESDNTLQNHQPSDEATNDLKLENSKKTQHSHSKKPDKVTEREREREKDNLVVDKSLHEVSIKAQNDAFQRVEKVEVVKATVNPKVPQGESSQRLKARLERERRTAERAARALAEKTMRDLAAQIEQAERNRLADSVGAQIKRWATGKEGNLRALLSTLQYILGPDSGWKPIPLTDVITPVSVKKAYRKATLYVHPDKVQQRGVNTQQKFICEKIYDLLKDAWNKFNSDGL